MNPRTILNAFVSSAVFLLFSVTALSQACPDHQALLDKLDKIFEDQALDRLKEVYHADAVVHTPEGTTKGLEAIIAANKKFFSDVPDAKGENLDVFCSGDKVAVRWEGSGTMSGKNVEVTGITIYHTQDGKIAEVWEAMDMMNIMTQLGYEIKPPGGGKN